MLLFISGKISGSTNVLMDLLWERNIPAFRFNLDMFDSYRFLWENDEFEITDPTGRCCHSREIDAMVFYKGIIAPWFSFEIDKPYNGEREWLISWLNRVYDCLLTYGAEHHQIRLWRPHGFGYAKTLQMKHAKKFFKVPDFKIYWGYDFDHQDVIVKPLAQRPLSNGEMVYAKIADIADLSSEWPWFAQRIAQGNRDATVLYVQDNVHCYQFATERGDLTDWRVTQGTEANKWEPWNAGEEFEDKVRAYMHDMGLKYGRLDFIIGGDEPEFLEVNPEGQFGWLDDENFTLHKEVLDAILDPSSTIEL